MSLYDDPLVTYDGLPTDAFMNQLMVKLDAVPADVLSAAQTTPIFSNVQQMNDAEVIGTGTSGDDWRGVGVPPTVV